MPWRTIALYSSPVIGESRDPLSGSCRSEVTVLDQRKDLFQPAILAVLNHLHQSKLILEMIEDKDILI